MLSLCLLFEYETVDKTATILSLPPPPHKKKNIYITRCSHNIWYAFDDQYFGSNSIQENAFKCRTYFHLFISCEGIFKPFTF